MHYQAAYLYLFNTLSDLIELYESIDTDREAVDIAAMLRHAQAEAEKKCTE